MALKSGAQFKGKVTCAFKNGMRNLFLHAEQEQDDEHFYNSQHYPYMQVRDSLEDKSMLLVHFRKVFPLALLVHS